MGPKKPKKSKQRRKEEAYLGVFGENSSSDEEDDGFGGLRSAFTKPVAFVSREILEPGKMEPPKIEPWEPPPPKKTKLQPPKKFPQQNKPVKSDMMTSNRPLESWDVGGVASKMMKAMGYTGGGLGKDGTGIAEAIEVQMRPDKACLSFNNRDERTAQSRRDFEEYEATGKLGVNGKTRGPKAQDETETMQHESRWKKGAQKRAPKPVYEFAGQQKSVQQQKIVDMRGPQTKVLDSYEGAVIPQNLKAPYLPELYHNLQILCDMKEASIHATRSGVNYEAKLKTQLQKEKVAFEIQITSEAEQIARLEEILVVVEHAQFKMSILHQDEHPLTLQFMQTTFEELQTLYPVEWHQFQLVALAYHIVFPLLTKLFSDWDPLTAPLTHLNTITDWRALLDPELSLLKKLNKKRKVEDTASPLQALANIDSAIAEYGNSNTPNPYLALFTDVVFPKFRHTIMNVWKPQEDTPRAMRLVTSWAPIIPPPTLKLIVEQLIYARLRTEVENWNPRTATILVSEWLHPWSQILSKEMMQTLLHPVLAKIGQALQQWNNIHDVTAHTMIAPWKAVLSPHDLEAFLQTTILPKLYNAFKQFTVQPNSQDMSIWTSVMKWKCLFQDETFVILLANEFFPKWINALYAWLSGEKPNYQEISKWYMDWKALMPVEIAQDPLVVQRFNQALEIMQNSMRGAMKPLPKFVRLEHSRIQNY